MMQSRNRFKLVLLVCFALYAAAIYGAEEAIRTPSQQMKEAVDKLNKSPATIGESLQGLTDAARAKLQQALGSKAKADSKAEPLDLNVPQKTPEAPAAAPALKEGSRDPFRPMTQRTKVNARVRENLSPLERFDLGQLKIVGIVWDIREPRAMIEDAAGLGYVVKVGTPIGSNDGKVKSIHRNQVIVEEFYEDAYGARKKRDVSMKLLTE
jgi:type IV pilus assembly protein PilP